MPKPLLREYVQLLEQAGYLEQDRGEYPIMRVTPQGRRALKDRLQIDLPKPRSLARLAPVSTSTIMDSADTGLFESLRALRKELADAQGVPPFVIFGDRSLHDMVRSRPQTNETFLDLFGVGEHKFEQYGKRFMERIRVYDKGE